MNNMKLALVLALALLPSLAHGDTSADCTVMSDIYANGKEMCEVMWDKSFKYTPSSQPAYTMWHFDAANSPNDAAATEIFGAPADTCKLQYYHKTGSPTPEDESFTECHPWKESSCCHQETVMDAETLRKSYGEGYEWDRCGKMSPECERFFVQEACLYECDANAGSYRLCSDADVENEVEKDIGLGYNISCKENTWQIYEMPIKASYCDAWYDACHDQIFCGHGSFFECKMEYDKTAKSADENEGVVKTAWAVPVMLVGGIAALGFGLFACVLVSREMKGKAMFMPLDTDDEKDTANDL